MFGAESPKSCSYPSKHFNVCSLSSFGVRVSGALFIAQPSHPPPSSMDGATAGGGGGVTGPAPFLIKTYEMVDDSSTDEIVSWSSAKNSFVVWNPPEFARLLLPSYFKHNNFSSFIRQLNTYGFRKSDPERWEFANEDFVKDKKHLLKNIHRRKPVHSHSNPQGTLADAERAAFDGEIERLSREKDELQMKVFRFKQQQPAKLQLEELTHRVAAMEERQERLLTFFEKAVQNPAFIKSLAQKIESMDFSAYNKKRRLPQVDHLQPVVKNSLLDNHSSSRPECGSIFHKDFSNKLKLELSPAASDINLLSQSTQSSNEDAGSPRMKISEGEPREAAMRTEGLSFAPETVELSDTGTSFTFKMDPNLSQRMEVNESQRLLCLQESLTSTEDGDGHMSCHLNLTLASSPLQVDKSSSNRLPQMGQEIGKYPVPRSTADHKNRNLGADDTTLSSSPGASPANQGPLLAQGRVNDVFWEQFLTERPGSSDNEEASSNLRSYPYDEQEDRRAGQGIPGNSKTMEHLTL